MATKLGVERLAALLFWIVMEMTMGRVFLSSAGAHGGGTDRCDAATASTATRRSLR